ncbi:MAG TPA: YIP1 family protein [Candidatus Angelobacter sp.]|nr:YIP1 family protein [Candidatus Angelobacter sp.]
MSAAIPPMPSEVSQPGLSEPQRIINIFTAPSKTFEDIRRNASWWVPWVIGGIFAAVSLTLFNNKADLEQLMRQQIASSPAQSQAFDGLSKEQQNQRIAIGVKISRVLPYVLPIFSLLGGLVIAALLMAAFNFIHEAAVPYKRSLAILFYAGLPSIISAVLAIVTLSMATDMEGRNPRNLVATNPAYFMDYQNTSKFLYGMAGSLDVITIWIIVLLGIGFKVNSAKPKLSTGTAIVTVAVLYMIWRLTASGLGWV